MALLIEAQISDIGYIIPINMNLETLIYNGDVTRIIKKSRRALKL